MQEWRKKAFAKLDTILILFEAVLSAVFVLLGYLINNIYIRGVGVGLIIAWVTSAIAYYLKGRTGVANEPTK